MVILPAPPEPPSVCIVTSVVPSAALRSSAQITLLPVGAKGADPLVGMPPY